MEQVLTAKMLIRPDKQEECVLRDTMQAYLRACNKISDYVFQTRDLKQKSLNAVLYYDLRQEFELGAQMAQSAIRSVIAGYKTLLSNGHEWTKLVYKHGFYDLVWNRDYSLKADCMSVNTLKGRLHLKFDRKGHEFLFDGQFRFGSAKIVRKHGKFYICVSYARDIPDTLSVSNVTGVDLGINFLAVSYDSNGKTEFWSGKECKQKRGHYKRLRRELQRRGTPSARRRLKRIGSRENRWMSDVNHCVSKALVNHNPPGTLFVLEDLNGIRNVTEKVRKKDRYVQVSWSFFDLRTKLEYKAKRAGSQVIMVDPKYTSQCCPKCGFVKRSNRDKRTHSFTCKSCGYRSNDDRVGAMNLHAKGIQYHSAVTYE